MLPNKLELLKVKLELDSETTVIHKELVEVLKARKKKQKPDLIYCKPWLLRFPSCGYVGFRNAKHNGSG